MEEQIKRVVRYTKTSYLLFWLLPVVIVVAGEWGGNWVGMYAGDARITYMVETLVVLLAVCCVPAALKLFAWVLSKKIDKVTIPVALHLYAKWSIIRLFLLAMPVLAGCLAYYLLLSNKSILCALIALTASLFCLPGEARLRNELKIDGSDL